MLELHTVPFGLGSVHGKILEMFWAQWDSKGLYRITICTKKERSPYFLLTQPLARLKQQQHQPEPARYYELKLRKVYFEVCVQGVHDYPQRLKSRFFYKESILNYGFPSGTFHSKNIYYNIDFHLQANTALSYQIST